MLDKESMSLNAYKILLIYAKIKNILLNVKIIILIILNHDNMHLLLDFQEIVQKMHDINAWNCM